VRHVGRISRRCRPGFCVFAGLSEDGPGRIRTCDLGLKSSARQAATSCLTTHLFCARTRAAVRRRYDSCRSHPTRSRSTTVSSMATPRPGAVGRSNSPSRTRRLDERDDLTLVRGVVRKRFDLHGLEASVDRAVERLERLLERLRVSARAVPHGDVWHEVVAPLLSEEAPCWEFVDLACEVPERHVDPAAATADLPRQGRLDRSSSVAVDVSACAVRRARVEARRSPVP
jgi:hypothetical protein